MDKEYYRKLVLLALTRIYRYRSFAAKLYYDLAKREADPYQKKLLLCLAQREQALCKRYQVYFQKLKSSVPDQRIGFWQTILRRLLAFLGPKAALNWLRRRENRCYNYYYLLLGVESQTITLPE